ncbi:hypothetical protein GcM1_242138 [Golovinomyces cichoracearum]|uniref:Uncharacterized protein n=1 Tax=Golovinomyces cichoracearum TaxID=62708 RepID=A0A420IH77_9PEZI|nr:hypothetical protein GcM1_242138 [Golovinomyces cichoracearum]
MLYVLYSLFYFNSFIRLHPGLSLRITAAQIDISSNRYSVMATKIVKKYEIDFLKYLRDSPLVLKPAGLPPVEQWIGIASDSTRKSIKPTSNKARNSDPDVTLDQVPRRPATDKHLPRSNANPEDIILGPPKTSFTSATSHRNMNKNTNSSDQSGIQENLFDIKNRSRINENDRSRDNRNNILRSRRIEGDQENNGWSTVQQRKSFGGEDTERNINRYRGDKNRDEKNAKSREEYDGKERSWGSNTFFREKDSDHDHFRERSHRNSGLGRGRHDPSWFKEKEYNEVHLNSKDRHNTGEKHVDRSRGWRGKEKDDRDDSKVEKYMEKNGEKQDQADRRWDKSRDQRHENEPEWMEDQVEEKHQAHTLADFEKWKEQMQGKDKAVKSMVGDRFNDPDTPLTAVEKSKIETPLDFDPGLDKFLGLINSKEEKRTDSMLEASNDIEKKTKITGKASRFTSFFTSQDESHKINQDLQVDTQSLSPDTVKNPKNNAQSDAEKEAFQQLLLKLQRQTLQASSSLENSPSQSKPSVLENISSASPRTQDVYQNYKNECHDEIRSKTRLSQQAFQDIFTQRQIASSQNAVRPEQMLQELVSQRQNALGQASITIDQHQPRNANTEFLMGLMQSAKSAADSKQLDAIHLGMPSKSDNCQILQQVTTDCEQELQRDAVIQPDRSAPERHARPQPPPGFYDESIFPRSPALLLDRKLGNSQSTTIIQRPPPPGLDVGWDCQSHLPPSQHRHTQNIAPPPGLPNNHNRLVPIPQQQVFPPGYPVGNFSLPDVMSASPRNIQMQLPPGFFNGPPQTFMPPTMGGFQGPDSMSFGGAPYDGRGPPPQGSFRRL